MNTIPAAELTEWEWRMTRTGSMTLVAYKGDQQIFMTAEYANKLEAEVRELRQENARLMGEFAVAKLERTVRDLKPLGEIV